MNSHTEINMRVKAVVERKMRAALRAEIKAKGLIDTGLMYESVEVYAEIDDFGVMEITIDGMFYIKYHWDMFRLFDFINRKDIPGWGTTKGLIIEAYEPWIRRKTKDIPIINWGGITKNAKVIFNLPE